jgi:hypothetical protein
MTIYRRVTVLPGGVIRCEVPELPVGTEVDVSVRILEETTEAESDSNKPPIWEQVIELGASIPMEEWEKVPRDLSARI